MEQYPLFNNTQHNCSVYEPRDIFDREFLKQVVAMVFYSPVADK